MKKEEKRIETQRDGRAVLSSKKSTCVHINTYYRVGGGTHYVHLENQQGLRTT